MTEERVLLWDSPNALRNRDANQLVFHKITWCVVHNSNGQGPSPTGPACHYSALDQATLFADVFNCEFVEKLIEV